MDFSVGLFCRQMRLIVAVILFLVWSGEFEGAGKEWPLLLLSSSFHASPFVLGGQILRWLPLLVCLVFWCLFCTL